MKSCALKLSRYRRHVKSALPVVIGGLVILSGCQVAHDLDYLHVFTHPSPTPVPTDVIKPGHPVAPSPSPSRVASSTTSAKTSARPNASPTAKQQTGDVQFPTAK